MTVTITPQTIITAASLLTAATALIVGLVKLVHWFDRQKKQDADIQTLRTQHNADMVALRAEEKSALAAIQDEQTLLTYGVLACLKGLQERGCNGPVTEAINKIEKYLNQKAHDVT